MDNSIQAHQKELCNKLWAMANALRGNMEAYEFKNYILGMILPFGQNREVHGQPFKR